MKQFIIFIFIILLSLNFATAQEQQGKNQVKYTNPFEQAGIKGIKILTLSNGKYQEFHDLDSVVQIGTTLINVNSRKIVGFVKKDSANSMPDASVSSRWISVDPLAERHYNHSPYIFTANNPILYVDPDGRDYGVYYDHENKTITIKAHFITLSKDEKSANQAVGFWNNQSGKYSYVIGEGKDAVAYTVNFSITTEVDDSEPTLKPNGEFYTSKGEEKATHDFSNESNSYISLPDGDKRFSSSEAGKVVNGVSDGDNAFVKESHKSDNTGSHEVGHNLGNSHNNGGLMAAVSSGGGVSKHHIGEMLGRVGLGNVRLGTTGGRGFVNGQTGTAPENFNSGKVMTTQKFQKMQEKLKKN
ncbi:RHS repeat-associated core domain-containing protein [Thermoflexibacter ruber]|uniref:YD repeat-containing protein n=1 Tax=Thermoflexibacter ruber TaxID=1003 RepID=A0A1I2JML5_9BACT|nr:hypothetical protein [Thermoflexibacter ruber]SFF56165.1 YD repeat-containing protein [Thermoflexibacter ruber]